MKKLVILLSMGMLAMVAGADTVNFTAGEGYTTGSLTDHADWNGNTEFAVNTSGTGTVGWGATSSIAMNYVPGVAASSQTIESSMQFRFTRVAGWTAAPKVVTGIFLETDSTGLTTAGLDDTRTFLERSGSNPDLYQVKFLNTTAGTVTDITTGTSFNQSLLGIAANGDVSDLLEIKLILHRGATEADWTADTILRNVTTDTSVYQNLGRAFTSTTAYFESDLYGSISGGTRDLNSGYTDRQLESFTVIPEPETLGLIGIASAGLLVVRRFLSV